LIFSSIGDVVAKKVRGFGWLLRMDRRDARLPFGRDGTPLLEFLEPVAGLV
jgi:hypothetical protein